MTQARQNVAQRDAALRVHLQRLLAWEDAHVGFDAATKGVPPRLHGRIPEGLPYSPWQLLEHLRRTQRDIQDFCCNPSYVDPPMEDLWPSSATPPTKGAWANSVAAFRRDRQALRKLAASTSIDLFDRIPHGSGQTYLRELLLVADHNAYHVGQLIAVRRCLGNWRSA